MKMLSFLFFLFFALSANAAPKWFFFDLGDTIVDTRNGYDKMEYMEGAYEYLQNLKANGYKIGLIVNIPVEWGTTYPEKMAKLQSFVDSGWIDPLPFNLKSFDAIYVPRFQVERKPSIVLFLTVSYNLWLEGETAVFQGEDPKEIENASLAGFTAYLVGSGPTFYWPGLVF